MIAGKALVLSAIRYQEKSLVVSCFTAEIGRKSFFVRDAFSGKANKFKSSYFEPLTQLEIVATNKQKGTLEYFKEVKLHHAYQQIPHHFVKRSLALFLAEILNQVIKEEEANNALFDYLENSLLILDETAETATFPLQFLLNLSSYLGFFPDFSAEASFFDLKYGVFQDHESDYTLSESESQLFRNLGLGNSNNFTKLERRAVLNSILEFYAHHIDHFKRPKSLDVLAELFG